MQPHVCMPANSNCNDNVTVIVPYTSQFPGERDTQARTVHLFYLDNT